MTRVLMDFAHGLVRTGLMEDGRLTEIFIDDPKSPAIIGNIYVGMVKNILPCGLAFVDVGLKQNAFLDLNDFREQTEVKQGHSVVIQILKDGIGDKGPTATTEIGFPGKGMIINVSATGAVGVSKKIGGKARRAQLKEFFCDILPEGYGAVVRTSAETMDDDILRAEAERLVSLSKKTLEYASYIKAPAVLYTHGHFLEDTVYRLKTTGFTELVINSAKEAEEIKRLLKEADVDAEVIVSDSQSLFSDYGVGNQMDKALQKKFWLSSGGFIYIEQTEACVVIDVNTGKYSGAGNPQKSMLKTNCEAAVEIARQIRLRNLSGMIIVDFIDLRQAEDRKHLQELFMDELSRDRTTINLVGMTELGLMQLTRKRVRPPLSEYLTESCPHCVGTGRIKK